jgi:hypothetical protein
MYTRCRAIVAERGTSLLQAIHAMAQGEAAAGDVAQASQALSDTIRVCLVVLMHDAAYPLPPHDMNVMHHGHLIINQTWH